MMGREESAFRSAWLLLTGILLFGAGCAAEPDPPARPLDPVAERYLFRGTQALEEGGFDVALAFADSAEERAPELPDISFLRGRIYAELGHISKADSAYRRTLALKPDYPGAWNNLGNNAYRQQRYSEAIQFYRRELQREPAPIPWRGIGRAYVELGRVDSAKYALERATEIDTSYAFGYFNLALLYEDEGDFEQALRQVRKAWALSPGDPNVQYMLGSLLLKTGQAEEALPHLLEVAEGQPWHHAAHYNLGQALVRLGRKEQGEAVLKRAEELRALDAKVQHQLGTVRSFPEDPLAHAALGSVLRRAGRYEEAMRAYQMATYLDPQNLDIRSNMASLHLIRQDTLRAIDTYEAILQQDSTFVDVWVNLGVVYALSGEKEKARSAWQAALRQKPDHEAASAFLAKLASGS